VQADRTPKAKSVEDPSVNWALIGRTVIGFAIGGSAVSMIVQIVILIRIAVGLSPAARRAPKT
jgi:hypothetical protein